MRSFLGISLVVLLACGGGSSGPADETLTMEIIGGDGQHAIVGGPVADPLAVRVKSESGVPKAGVRIDFSVQSGEAELASSEAETDQDGTASVEATMGHEAGAVEVAAQGGDLGGSPLIFHLAAVPGAPATLTATSGDGQATFPGRTLPVAIALHVTDQFGNPTPGTKVVFGVDAGSGSVRPTTKLTDATGAVSASWTVGSTVGEQVLVARVESGASLSYHATVVSPGGGTIAVSSFDDPLQILLMHPDGTNLAPLPNGQAGDRNPLWSPDGSRIAFNTLRFGGIEAATMHPDGSGLVRATPLEGNTYAEVVGWSPDGTRLLVTSNVDLPDGSRLYIAKADGTGALQAVPNTDGVLNADWSPDGQKIAFSTGSGDPQGIFLVKVDGSGLQFLAVGQELRWSPDGSRIAFNVRDIEGLTHPYLMNPDGSGQTPFPGTSGMVLRFQGWSPDGLKALFTGFPDPSSDEFYSINADGTGLVRITYDDTATIGGAWGP